MKTALGFVLTAFLTLSTRVTYGQVNIFISETGQVGGVLVAALNSVLLKGTPKAVVTRLKASM